MFRSSASGICSGFWLYILLITTGRARTWPWARMRRWDELCKDQGPLLLRRFCLDCIIVTRGYDFWEGQGEWGVTLNRVEEASGKSHKNLQSKDRPTRFRHDLPPSDPDPRPLYGLRRALLCCLDEVGHLLARIEHARLDRGLRDADDFRDL